MDILAEFMAKISMVKSRKSAELKQASCAHVGGYRSENAGHIYIPKR